METMSTTPAGVEVRPLLASDQQQWRQYVSQAPGGTAFHMPAWSTAVEEAYGHRPMHLGAWHEGKMVGVLPMFLVKSLLAGKVLVSLPYATYGGIVADTPVVLAMLAERAKDYCGHYGCKYLELRHRDANGLELPQITRYDTFRKQLAASTDEIMAGLAKKRRATLRSGFAALGPDCVSHGQQWLDAIYELYAYNLRRLGSPNYSRRFFHELQKSYGDDCDCLVALHNNQPIAGVISFIFRDELITYFCGCRPEANKLDANDVMYFKLMEYALQRGLKWFDFNRTRRDNTGPYNFKRHFGFEPAPLHYHIYRDSEGEMPNLSPSNVKFSLAIKTWRKLPLWLTKRAGAKVTKWIP